MRAILAKLRENRQGGVLVETALGLPILLGTMIGCLEVSHFYFVTASVENAVLHASRFGITGDSGENSREERIREIIDEQTYGRVNMDTVVIETLVYEQFGDIGEEEPYVDANDSGSYEEGETYSDVNGNNQWDADMAIVGLGGSGDIVLYRVTYEAPSLTGIGIWKDKSINISATVAVRNEPY